MRTGTSLLLGAALVGSTWMATTPASQTGGIGLVNGARILEGSNIGRQAREQLETAAGSWEQRIATAGSELETLTRQRQEQSLTLNVQALARLNQDIEEKQVMVTRMQDDARRELQRFELEVTGQVNSQLGPLVEQFAQQRGLDMIFDTSQTQGLLYFGAARDMTDSFLALVNSTPAPTSAQ